MQNREAAEHAHAADRFAREIVGFLTVCIARSRRLMGRPLGRPINASTSCLTPDIMLSSLRSGIEPNHVARAVAWLCIAHATA